jgi:hypothetical protein
MKLLRIVFADRFARMGFSFFASMFVWLIASSGPASAQGVNTQTRPWYVMILDLHTLPYVLGSAVFCYLLSVVLTMIFMRSGYPPNVARFAVWFGVLVWLILQVAVVFRFIVLIAFPLWFQIALLLFIVAFGIILMTTKRQSA